MIKNNRHDTYVKSVPDIIRDVIVYGTHTLTAEESLYFNQDEFFTDYDVLLKRMNFPAVPLSISETGEQKKAIVLHPDFLQKLTETFQHNSFESYQYLFNKRFEMLSGEEEADSMGVFEEKPQNKSDAPTLPSQKMEIEGEAELDAARQYNADYASAAALGLFDDASGFYLDDYGMVENRLTLFCQNMDAICDKYVLPRLRVDFDADGLPYFNARDKDIDTVKKLYHERKEKMVELEADIRKTSNSDINYNIAMNLMTGTLRGVWALEAVKSTVKTQTLSYSSSFMKNTHDLMALNGGHVSSRPANEAVIVPSLRKNEIEVPCYN